MRLVIAAALALAAAPAAAQPVELGPGEVLLEVEARGLSVTKADVALLTVVARGRGATAAAARAEKEAAIARFTAAARAQGIAGSQVSLVRGRTLGFVGNEAPEEMVAVGWAVEPGPDKPQIPRTDSATLEIRLPDAALYERVRDALEAAGANFVSDLTYRIADESAALRAAKADALRRAREQASAYARQLGLRVLRLVKVSERAVSEQGRVGTMQDLSRMILGDGVSGTGEVERQAIVAADFVLAPQR